MQFSDSEIEELSAATCPHCAAGIAVRRRADTGEWVHDQVATSQGVVKGHSICWGNGIRTKYASAASATDTASAGASPTDSSDTFR